MSDPDEDYFVPLEDQRVFGAGIKRKRVTFVPAASTTTPATPNGTSPSACEASSIAERYLSIVLPDASSTTTPPSPRTSSTPPPQPTPLCTVCARPLSPTHQSTIAHQVCLTHSHPPSHLDRSRNGMRYLQSYGWDPDSRTGLGPRAEGRRFPVKPVPKHDTVGLREKEDVENVKFKVRKSAEVREGKVVKVDAKEVKRREGEARRRAEKLRGLFYQSEEVQKYLGELG